MRPGSLGSADSAILPYCATNGRGASGVGLAVRPRASGVGLFVSCRVEHSMIQSFNPRHNSGVLEKWMAAATPSREAAKECSPGRKPWVEAVNDTAPKGRKMGRGRPLWRPGFRPIEACRVSLGLDGRDARPYRGAGCPVRWRRAIRKNLDTGCRKSTFCSTNWYYRLRRHEENAISAADLWKRKPGWQAARGGPRKDNLGI